MYKGYKIDLTTFLGILNEGLNNPYPWIIHDTGAPSILVTNFFVEVTNQINQFQITIFSVSSYQDVLYN